MVPATATRSARLVYAGFFTFLQRRSVKDDLFYTCPDATTVQHVTPDAPPNIGGASVEFALSFVEFAHTPQAVIQCPLCETVPPASTCIMFLM